MHNIHEDQKNHSHLGEALALAALGAGMLAGRWIRKKQIAARQKRAAMPKPIVPNAHAAGAVATGAAEPSPALAYALACANAQLEIDRPEPAAPMLAAGGAPSVDPSDANAEPETFFVDVRGGQITTRGDASGDAMLRWRTFRDALIDVRGHSSDANGTLYPNTTIYDVQQVAALWTEWLTTHSHALPDNLTVRVRWMIANANIDCALRHGDPSALHPRNERFWLVELHDLAHSIAKHEDEFPFLGLTSVLKKLGAQRLADLNGHSATALAAAETALADSAAPTVAPTEPEPFNTHDHRSGGANTPTGQGSEPEPCDTHDHRSGDDDSTSPGTDCDEPSDTPDHRSGQDPVTAAIAQQAGLVVDVLDRAARALRSPTVLGALLAFGGAALITAER